MCNMIKRRRALIEVVHCDHDAILEFLSGRDADTTQDRADEFGKGALDRVEPGCRSWGEVEGPAAMPCQPLAHLRMLVGCVVVDDRRGSTIWQGRRLPEAHRLMAVWQAYRLALEVDEVIAATPPNMMCPASGSTISPNPQERCQLEPDRNQRSADGCEVVNG
jgi:hypothetical protein